jgi:hypothetical protein
MKNPIPKYLIELIDQVFEIEKKVQGLSEKNSIDRNVSKMKSIFEDLFFQEREGGLIYHNPMGEAYKESRTDLEASIAGNSTDELIIVEVIKPIIRYKNGGITQIVRKGVVVVETKKD